jgi:phage terminase large subunit-like protein
MKAKDKEALQDWLAHKQAIERATTITIDEDFVAKKKRVDALSKDVVAFAQYYFPHYCQNDFAQFHKRFFKKAIDNDRIFMTRAWSRAHAKSVCAGVVLPLYLMATGKIKNMLMVSYNESNAIQLLTPIKLELESNQRLVNDYGMLKGLSSWEAGKFVTTTNVSFRALGSGQSPRGTRNQEQRPDFILCDDMDEDELCRNPRRLDQTYDWMIGALYGCFDIVGAGRFIIVNNIIAKDSLLKRAIKVSDDHEQIDIYDKHNNPSWKERFTKEECQYMIDKMGYRLSQREYFNNPISEGKVFKKEWFQFKKLPPLHTYNYLIAYLDPGFKKTSTSDSKALVLVGLLKGEFHIRKVFCGKASVEEMIEWGYACDEYVKSKNASYKFKMEEVFLQSLLYKDFAEVAKTKGYAVPVSGDTRKKPDKDARIEAMSGYFERGQVYIDEAIEQDHHCIALVEQFLNFESGVKTLKDGPDATEGAFHLLQQSVKTNADIIVNNSFKSRHKI